jgi:hypothetical protein
MLGFLGFVKVRRIRIEEVEVELAKGCEGQDYFCKVSQVVTVSEQKG